MKKYLIIIVFTLLAFANLTYAIDAPSADEDILNKDFNKILEVADINDPLRDWAYGIIWAENADPDKKITSVMESWKITQHKTAMDSTLGLVKTIINYLLWFIWLVALLYLIYNGFLMLTAAWDDTQYKKWLKSLKYAGIAIWWIWISWLFVSLIFWIISKFIW